MIYEIPEENRLDLRVKWSLDGCANLEEAASSLRAYADELDKLHVQGWRFEDAVDQGSAEIVHDDPRVRYENWKQVENRADDESGAA